MGFMGALPGGGRSADVLSTLQEHSPASPRPIPSSTRGMPAPVARRWRALVRMTVNGAAVALPDPELVQ